MKIYILRAEIVANINFRHFSDLTDEEVLGLCAKDDRVNRGEWHAVYTSVEELAERWNDSEVFTPQMSYMRIINE